MTQRVQRRSARWFDGDGMREFAHRQRSQQMGFSREEFMDRPVVAILNTWSDLSPCHAHLRERAQDVARGITRAGGFAVELPALSLGEVMVKPTTMLYRNMLAMEAEELLRSHPVDAVVLLGGCDKTVPGLMMGALSMGLPAIFVPAGPMMSGHWRGRTLGAGTHTRHFWDERQAGNLSDTDWVELEGVMTRSPGTCQTMGTASTMTLLIEAMGFTLPGASSIPAMDSAHRRMAYAAGVRAVAMADAGPAPAEIATEAAFSNAAHVLCAIGGSTNAAIHLAAMAGRAGVDLPDDLIDAAARRTPCLVNLMPAGEHLMADLFRAGGLPAVMNRIAAHLDPDAPTVTGEPLGDRWKDAECWDDAVIRPLADPVSDRPALARLTGNLAPRGALMKPTAASPRLLEHSGPAIVFDGPADMRARIDDPGLDVTADSVLVLRGGGPLGGPGMPEWGNLPIPKKLLKQGVRDMLRISDARMSGTHGGTCVLHVCPESAAGGPLAALRDGDVVTLSLSQRRLDVALDEAEIAERLKAHAPPAPPGRGWTRLYAQHVEQADRGCDFDFLRGAGNPEPGIF
ncbi:dihydroxy-acid dehydratase [Jannaschia formosa]|uniref:dihydroxy-acid dehydratase n=1 Tax=Jannaschia formosa TaxID=2259592 RepID=UPI000E1C08B7|nr:dihydroxy-acid dehydratase [Jannaschia formosa]TFL16053.1 dihydroxy-acid dehydratase [Jannaschia formosa]